MTCKDEMTSSETVAQLSEQASRRRADEPLPARAGLGAGRTWGTVRVPSALPAALAASVAAFGLLMYLTRHIDFLADDWDWVDGNRAWTPRDYFVPHNEHWSTVPMLLYKLVFLIQGTHSHAPFAALMVSLHVAAGFLLFLVIRERAGELLGLAAAALYLFLGTGSDDLLWAFQTGFDASLAFGLLALYLLRGAELGKRRTAAGSAALMLSLASSGIGLFFLITAGIALLLDRERRRRAWWALIVPVLGYALWYESFGKQAITSHRNPFSLTALDQLVGYVPAGVGAAASGVFGRSPGWSALILPLLCALLAVSWFRERRVPGPAIGVSVGLVAQFALTGLVRAQYGDAQATASRYVAVAAAFVLILLTEAVRDVPWRGLWRAVFAVVLAVALAGNLAALHTAQRELAEASAFEDVGFQTAWLFRDAPGLHKAGVIEPANAPTLTAGDYIRARTELGSPLRDVTVGGLADLHADAVNQSMRNIMPLIYMLGSGGTVSGCTAIGLSGGTQTLMVAGGSSFEVSPASVARISIGYWYLGRSPGSGYTPDAQSVPAGRTLVVRMPDTGFGLSWHVRVDSPVPALVCRG
jgi:hypothetical protein